MTELEFIKGKKIICIYDREDRSGKLERGGWHNAQYRIVSGNTKKAYAVVSLPLSWAQNPKKREIDLTNVGWNARVEDWKLFCCHKEHHFPGLIKKGADDGRTKATFKGHPYALVCKDSCRLQFIK